MVQADQGSGRPFTRTRWWWVRHAPVRAHGGQIYGQADLACDCSDDVVLQSVARVLPKGAVWVSSHLSRTRYTSVCALPRAVAVVLPRGGVSISPHPTRPRHTAEVLWRSGYLDENET